MMYKITMTIAISGIFTFSVLATDAEDLKEAADHLNHITPRVETEVMVTENVNFAEYPHLLREDEYYVASYDWQQGQTRVHVERDEGKASEMLDKIKRWNEQIEISQGFMQNLKITVLNFAKLDNDGKEK